jgi:plastocyanin
MHSTTRAGAFLIAALLLAGCRAAGSESNVATASPRPTGSPEASIPGASAPSSSSPTATAALGSPPPATEVDPRTDGLDVTFGEFAITLEAPAIRPGPVTFVVHNAGHLTHGFEMKIDGGHGSDGGRMEIETRTFQSGETLRVEADLPPGTYEIECFVSDHDERGMRTMLEVRADAPLVTIDPTSSSPGAVRIVQFAFVAADLDVEAGSRITWTNEDPTPHTVTAEARAFDSLQLESGESFSTTLEQPGDYRYRCEIHPTMTGTVHVR